MSRFSWRRLAGLIPRWSQLRAVGNSGPAKLTILIPLVGYYIIFNAQLVHYLDLVSEIGGPTMHSHSVPPRLLLIYFSLCFFAVGAAIYSVLCPDEVKRYGSSAAYVGEDGPSLKAFASQPIAQELRNSPYANEYEEILQYNNLRISQDFSIQEARVEIQNGRLHLYFRYKDKSYPSMRLIAFLCYIIGIIGLSIPSLGVFVRVVRILWGTFPLSVLF
jgi:hypothetical protein